MEGFIALILILLFFISLNLFLKIIRYITNYFRRKFIKKTLEKACISKEFIESFNLISKINERLKFISGINEKDVLETCLVIINKYISTKYETTQYMIKKMDSEIDSNDLNIKFTPYSDLGIHVLLEEIFLENNCDKFVKKDISYLLHKLFIILKRDYNMFNETKNTEYSNSILNSIHAFKNYLESIFNIKGFSKDFIDDLNNRADAFKGL